MALLLILHALAPVFRIKLTVAHLNHGIRGKSAAADAAFVRKLARTLGLPCVCGRANVPRLARKSRLSVEMAARQARYAFLSEVARTVEADVLATAHTADDQAETILLKLARGAGPRGLAGIPREGRVNGLRVIRPLLDIPRKDIVRYLRSRRQSWREDESNDSLAHLRNRIRHKVLPLLESELNPEIRPALIRTAEILREEDRCLDGMARACLAGSRSRI